MYNVQCAISNVQCTMYNESGFMYDNDFRWLY